MIDVYENVFTSREIMWMHRYMSHFDGWQLIFDDSEEQSPSTYSLGRAIDQPNFGPFEEFLIRAINSRIKTIIPDFHRVVYNAFRPGDDPSLHIDGEYDGSITVMVYPNEEWYPSWGGETVFFRDDECIDSIIPKPGRVVMFPGNLLHGATAPSKNIKAAARFSVALQFCPGQEDAMEYHAQFQPVNRRPFPPLE